MNLDLSKFKKVESTDKHTVLSHPSGHKIKIAHQGLSNDLRNQIEAMPGIHAYAKGGEVYTKRPGKGVGVEAAGVSKASGASKSSRDPEYTEPRDLGTQQPKPQSMGSGQYAPCLNPSCKSYGHSHPNCRCYSGSEYTQGFAEGGEAEKEYYCDTNRPHFKSCEYHRSNENVQMFAEKGEVEPETASQQLEQAAQEANAGASGAPIQDDSSQVSTEPQTPRIDVPESSTPDTMVPPQEIQSEAPATPDQNQTPDQTQPSVEMPAADTFQKYKNDHLNQLIDQSKAFLNEMGGGTITPQHYFHLFSRTDANGQPTFMGKIGAAFGLMLGGIGSGLTHQPNAVIQIMNNEINNELKAQELSQGNKQNLLRINQEGMMNQARMAEINQDIKNKSFALTKMQLNYFGVQNLANQISKLPDSAQKQRQMQALAFMNQGVQNENYSIASRQATASALADYVSGGQGGSNPNGAPNTMMMKSGLLGPEVSKMGEDIESKTMPGLAGQATYSLGGGDKDELRKGLVFDKAINDLTQWAKAHPNGALPGTPEDQRGRALAGIVQGSFRGATNGGVYKSGEQDFINKLVPEDPTKAFNAYRVTPKLEAVQKEMASQLDAKAKSYGFKGYPGMQQNNAQVKTVNGIKYKKGPNGEAVRVQ